MPHDSADRAGREVAKCWGSAGSYPLRHAVQRRFLAGGCQTASTHTAWARLRRGGSVQFQLLIPGDDFDAFVNRGLDHVLQRRIPQKFFGCIELEIACPFGAREGFGQIPLPENVGDSTRSAPTAHPFNITVQLGWL